ncbi:MAG: hypothetical protein IKU51_02490 [Clostridia bacterium]|nr:hypothetical protein [Clostridia bacterium]
MKKQWTKIVGFISLGLLTTGLLACFIWYYDCMLATKDYEELPNWHIDYVEEFVARYQENPYGVESPEYGPYGPVKNAAQARRIARKVWTDYFDKTIFSNRPYQVAYSDSEKMWYVYGSLPFYTDGGVPNIVIREETGEIVAFWHDK